MKLHQAKYRYLPLTAVKPGGWLYNQLKIQADGLAGQLDGIWPDVRDSAWIGGTAEGWERVPYWLDGFIPLGVLLDDEDLKARAKYYVESILSRQGDDGWLCPGAKEERGKYDVWSFILICKVLYRYAGIFDREQIIAALRRAARALHEHLKTCPLYDWGRFRWYEMLPVLAGLYIDQPEEWLLELKQLMQSQGFDYHELVKDWRFTGKTAGWGFEEHVVNLAMALRVGPLCAEWSGEDSDEPANELLEKLFTYHSMACGHFTGDECLAGDSPIQGTELCGVVEAMHSYEELFRFGGKVKWADQLERLAFNALPAATTSDMWAHQYDQQTNQIGSVFEENHLWSTNGGDAHRFGLEPFFGCCTANFGQGWPKLAASAIMRSAKGFVVMSPVPLNVSTEVNGVKVRLEVKNEYPFRDRVEILIESETPVEFDLELRIPEFAKSARIDGAQFQSGKLHRICRQWSGCSKIVMDFEFEAKLTERPNGMFALWRGPLLFSLPIAFESEMVEYIDKGVERRFPYCDYNIRPVEKWGYAWAGDAFEFEEGNSLKAPFSVDSPPCAIYAELAEINWELAPNMTATCAARPADAAPLGPPRKKRLIPYGATLLRITELPKNTSRS